MSKFALLAALLFLAACASGPSRGSRIDWSCDDERAFSVRIGATDAEIFAAGRIYTLPQARSGSGVRYTNNAVEYWEHQGGARLTGAFGGPYENCRRG
jgi:membrane-bound inhibitor of C-type lysozyme